MIGYFLTSPMNSSELGPCSLLLPLASQVLADPVLAPFYEGIDMEHLKSQQVHYTPGYTLRYRKNSY